jgi:hypothetical protein
MPNFRTKIRRLRDLRTKIALPALLALVPLTPGAGVAAQPLWQPAIYCAALEFTRAELLDDLGDAAPARAGTPEGADLAGRTYLRIAAEAMDCPAPAQLEAMLDTIGVGIAHRIDLAAQYGHGPEVTVLPLASESELVCELHFDPALLERARADEDRTPPAPLCPGSG